MTEEVTCGGHHASLMGPDKKWVYSNWNPFLPDSCLQVDIKRAAEHRPGWEKGITITVLTGLLRDPQWKA